MKGAADEEMAHKHAEHMHVVGLQALRDSYDTLTRWYVRQQLVLLLRGVGAQW